MPTSDDIRISKWDLSASAGTTARLVFTSPTALTSLSVYVGGTTTDVDDLTGATAYAATLSGANLVATVDLVVPTGGLTPLRLVVNGAVQTVGHLTPSTRGTASPDNTITLVAGTSTYALTILGTVVSAADVPYLVTTATSELSAEVVVGATPGGELGGTWAAPTVDATHSGSTHASVQAAAEATAAADATSKVATHASDTTSVHGFADSAAVETKVGHLTVTQAVDLDAIETRVNSLDAAVVLRGSWDASAGTFPGGGTAQAGDSYIVSVGGTVDAIVFTANDRIVAITDNASTGTYAANWLKLDYTDQVLSVDGQTGAVSLAGTYVPQATLDANTLLKADSDNTPVALSVAEQTLVGRITAGSIDDLSPAQVRTLLDVPTTGEAVLDTLYDANTVLKADSDNTPTALTMGASTILARLAAGNIVAATPAELRTLLALVIGTNVQAWDADLDAIAALTSAADKMPYSTAAQTWALATLTSFARTLLDDADAATARTTLAVPVEVLADVTLGSAAATIDVQSIPAAFFAIRGLLTCRSAKTGTDNDQIRVRFNNDSGANYDDQAIRAYSATADGAERTGQTAGEIGTLPAANAPADHAGAVTFDIIDYGGTFEKTLLAEQYYRFGAAAGGRLRGSRGVNWQSVAVINRITLLLGAGDNFVTGTRLVLLGMGRL